jgi:hypothetical protein
MKTSQILVGSRYTNGKGLVCEVIAEGPEHISKQMIALLGNNAETDRIRYRVVASTKEFRTQPIGHEGTCARRAFSIWAKAKVGVKKDTRLDGTVEQQVQPAVQANRAKASVASTPEIQAKPTAAPERLVPREAAQVVVESALNGHEAVKAIQTSTPLASTPERADRPSMRTFYLTPEGVITKVKPPAFTQTARAQNAAEAKKILGGHTAVLIAGQPK